MTDAFMAEPTVRDRYGLEETDTFDARFSTVSLESILFYVVAAAIYTLEVIFDTFGVEVEQKIRQGIVASVPWYYMIAKSFQYGDGLVYDDTTKSYGYPTVNPDKQVVKYAAVRDEGNSISVMVAGDGGGHPVPLSNDVLMAFKSYMNKLKIVGVLLNVYTRQPDDIQISVTVQVDPALISTNGTKTGESGKPVEEAITAYLAGIVYGGTFNKTKLVDAIQNVSGVVDVVLGEVLARPNGDVYSSVTGNNYTAFGGAFLPDNLSNTIRYVV